MTAMTSAALRRAVRIATPLALALGLAACSNSKDNAAAVPPPVAVVPPAPAPTPAPTPTPTPTPSPASRNVTACLNQVIPGTGGLTPTTLVIPDTLRLSFASPNGFPNGRRLNDPVVDIELAVLLLDLRVHSAALLATAPPNGRGPINPAPDDAVLPDFPFFQTAVGGQPSPGTGTAFSFRTDPASAYTRVDRMGQPAIGAVLIGGTQKNPFADGSLQQDIDGVFVPGPDGIVQQLTNLHNQIADDLIALGLTVCST